MNSPQESRTVIPILGLLVLYGGGVAGLTSPFAELFLRATPMVLIITAAVLIWHHRPRNATFTLSMVLVALAGYGVEVLGVHTGWVFGEYSYGTVLGPRVLDVPLLIGVNWMTLVAAASTWLEGFSLPKWAQITLGALTLTLFDGVMEPAAIRLGFWQWENTTPPLQNYLAWVVISAILLILFDRLNPSRRNPLGGVVLLLNGGFFAALLVVGG